MARAFIVAAPRSGSGKTSVTIGLLRAFRRRGLAVAGAKSGPDFIDPGFHAAATGQPGVNLDSWSMAPAALDRLAGQQVAGADLLIAESAMGLFDGLRLPPGQRGSAADLARRWQLPVLLVLDVSGQSQSAAAVAMGFAGFDKGVRVAGVVLNQVASDRHALQTREAVEDAGLPVLGVIRRNADMALPERHLGLVQASEHQQLEAFIERLADTMEASLDLDAIAAIACPLVPDEGSTTALPAPPGQRIAIAQDAAFTFLYPHLGRHWQATGAQLHAFSPLADEVPPDMCDACWLPGGYPELHAGRLAEASAFRNGLRRFAETRPVHGECGGFMVMGRTLEDADGKTHEMAGLLGHSTSYRKRRLHLGYREARLAADGVLGPAGSRVRGHEFHYARVVDDGPDAPFAELFDGLGQPLGRAGGQRGLASGTFFHLIARAPE